MGRIRTESEENIDSSNGSPSQLIEGEEEDYCSINIAGSSNQNRPYDDEEECCVSSGFSSFCSQEFPYDEGVENHCSVKLSEPSDEDLGMHTKLIWMMDTTSDITWRCCVFQKRGNGGRIISFLNIQRFSAIFETQFNDEDSCETFEDNTYTPHRNIESPMNFKWVPNLDISKYIDLSNSGHKYLSISPNGQYITLSTYNEEKGDVDEFCLVFFVSETGITLGCKIRCNGRAVFLNRENELCLAIVNTETLKIYNDIHIFSEDMPYKLYDLAPFKHIDCERYITNIACHSFQSNSCKANSNFHFIEAISTFIKDGIISTIFSEETRTTRLWSLNNQGLRLASFSTPKDILIAISKDLVYAATQKSYHSGTIINVFNLKKGCIEYSLRAIPSESKVTHAQFCGNSRYLAISAVRQDEEFYMAVFAIWFIADQECIYETERVMVSYYSDLPLQPFIYEEKGETNELNLTGFYHDSGEAVGDLTTVYFRIIVNTQRNGYIKWLPPLKQMTFEIDWIAYKIVDVSSEHDPVDYYLDRKKADSKYYENDVTKHLNDCGYNKCGYIHYRQEKFLIRCGYRLIQLWQHVQGSLEEGRIENYRLIYIKPYINLEKESCYLYPNISTIVSFGSIRDFGYAPYLRVTLTVENRLETYEEAIILRIPTDCHENDFEYRKFKGACQTIYYLNICSIQETGLPISMEKTSGGESFENDLKVYFKLSMSLIESEIKKLDGKCSSFKTADGSKLVAMLASFQSGRYILKLLLKNEAVTFNISSYNVTNIYGKGEVDKINLLEETRYAKRRGASVNQSGIVMTESVLDILIREREYNLYHLIFNRILIDAKNTGPDCLSILNDALFLLQQFGVIDHFEKSCQKLSYIRAGKGAILSSEIPPEILQKADLQNDLIANVGSIFYFSTMEEIRKIWKHEANFKNLQVKTASLLYSLGNIYVFKFFKWIAKLLWRFLVDLLFDLRKKPSNQFVMCVAPFPHFNTYSHSTARDVFNDIASLRSTENSSAHLSYSKKSMFLQSALNQHSEPNVWKQGDDVMAIILQYKWNAFIRKRFFVICIIHIIYYVTYSTGVQFALELYDYDASNDRSITDTQHVISLICFFLSGSILLTFELLQIFKNKKLTYYLKSWYNYVDIAAIVLPLFTFLQLILNWDYFYEVSSVSVLILWLHGIVRLRVFSSFGIALETILKLFKEVNSVLFILLIVVIGFTHSFIVLLRQQEDQYFQENYTGDTSLNETTGSTTLYDLSSSNGFSDPFKAFYQVWLFIFGVWDPVTSGDAGDNRMLFVLCIVFAFITVLIFTNMIIALMSSTVDEVKQRGKKVWMTHFAAVIAEIESLTFSSTRHDRKNNPAFIFYAGNAEKVIRQERKLKEETQELRKLLMIDGDEQIKTAKKVKSDFQLDHEAVKDLKHLNEKSMEDTQLNPDILEELKLENEMAMKIMQDNFYTFKNDNEKTMEDMRQNLQRLEQLLISMSQK